MKQNKSMVPNSTNPKLEGHLRDTQNNREKSARMTNAARQELGRMGGERPAEYEDWSKADLYDRAKELGIEEIAEMDQEQLIEALREH
jgi:hypothetical protein